MNQCKKAFGLFSVVALLVLTGAIAVSAGEKGSNDGVKIAKKDVPAVVLKAFETAYPQASKVSFEKIETGGVITYKVETGKGKAEKGKGEKDDDEKDDAHESDG